MGGKEKEEELALKKLKNSSAYLRKGPKEKPTKTTKTPRVVLTFRQLLALFKPGKVQTSQQPRHEEFKRGNDMGKRMTGKSKKTQRKSGKGNTKKKEKPK